MQLTIRISKIKELQGSKGYAELWANTNANHTYTKFLADSGKAKGWSRPSKCPKVYTTKYRQKESKFCQTEIVTNSCNIQILHIN